MRLTIGHADVTLTGILQVPPPSRDITPISPWGPLQTIASNHFLFISQFPMLSE